MLSVGPLPKLKESWDRALLSSRESSVIYPSAVRSDLHCEKLLSPAKKNHRLYSLLKNLLKEANDTNKNIVVRNTIKELILSLLLIKLQKSNEPSVLIELFGKLINEGYLITNKHTSNLTLDETIRYLSKKQRVSVDLSPAKELLNNYSEFSSRALYDKYYKLHKSQMESFKTSFTSIGIESLALDTIFETLFDEMVLAEIEHDRYLKNDYLNLDVESIRYLPSEKNHSLIKKAYEKRKGAILEQLEKAKTSQLILDAVKNLESDRHSTTNPISTGKVLDLLLDASIKEEDCKDNLSHDGFNQLYESLRAKLMEEPTCFDTIDSQLAEMSDLVLEDKISNTAYLNINPFEHWGQDGKSIPAVIRDRFLEAKYLFNTRKLEEAQRIGQKIFPGKNLYIFTADQDILDDLAYESSSLLEVARNIADGKKVVLEFTFFKP